MAQLLLETQKISPGSYQCVYADPTTHQNHQANLTVTKLGDTYKFIWMVDGKAYYGTGIFNKKVANVIAVSEYWEPINASNTGIAIYHITEDGSLEGNWAETNYGFVSDELCQKQSLNSKLKSNE